MQKTMPKKDMRLRQIMQTLDKAEAGLKRSQQRLFVAHNITASWILSIEDKPEQEDMMEAFVSKFNRFQDMLGDKLIPALLSWKEERPGALIDNLHRMERLGFIVSTQQWLVARNLRNQLVHEYMHDAQELAQSLQLANELSSMLLQTWQRIKTYIEGGLLDATH